MLGIANSVLIMHNPSPQVTLVTETDMCPDNHNTILKCYDKAGGRGGEVRKTNMKAMLGLHDEGSHMSSE